MSSGGNCSLSDVIIQQPRLVDPSLCLSLRLSPALSCYLFLSRSSRVVGGGHTHHRGQIAGLSLSPLFCRMLLSDEREMRRTALVYNRGSV